MLTQKQWKIQLLIEHMANVAVSTAAEAARRSAEHQPMVREHAIIAEELRSLTLRMTGFLEQNLFNSLDECAFDTAMKEMITRSTYLALNAALLASKVQEHKPLAVFAEEIGAFSLELSKLYGQKQQFVDIPIVTEKSRVFVDYIYLFRTVSGRYTWYENTRFVDEVLLYNPDFIQHDRLIIKNEWRDMDMPIINLGKTTENTGIVIVSDDRDPTKHYAVLSEIKVHSNLICSYVGISNRSTSADIPVRECWLATDGSEMRFLDWEKLVDSPKN